MVRRLCRDSGVGRRRVFGQEVQRHAGRSGDREVGWQAVGVIAGATGDPWLVEVLRECAGYVANGGRRFEASSGCQVALFAPYEGMSLGRFAPMAA